MNNRLVQIMVLFIIDRLIKPEHECLFAELCEEQIQMHIRPAIVKARKKQRKIATELSDLKKRMEEATSKNIVLSNREIRLFRYLILIEDEKENVARKLERLENMDHDKAEIADEIDDDDDNKTDDHEY